MRVVVYHAYCGCDTGCCGHIVKLEDGREEFSFDHPGAFGSDDPKKFAEEQVRAEFGEEHVADLDWESCQIRDD